MPNLEERAVIDWLTEVRPITAAEEWLPAIRPIEAVADAPRAFEELGQTLDELSKDNLDVLSLAIRTTRLRYDLRAVIARVGAARLLRLLHWFVEQELPDCNAVVAALVEGDTPEARALRTAIAALTRRAQLRRLFAPERVAALQAASEIALKETA
jgi:hypothetical protein